MNANERKNGRAEGRGSSAYQGEAAWAWKRLINAINASDLPAESKTYMKSLAAELDEKAYMYGWTASTEDKLMCFTLTPKATDPDAVLGAEPKKAIRQDSMVRW